MDNTEKTTLILVEDDPDVAEKLAETIGSAPHLELLGSSATLNGGLDQLRKHNPDVMLTDLGLPDGSGIDLIQAIQNDRLDTQAIVLTGFQDENLVFSAIKAGAKGYILKSDESQNIIASIDSMLKGGAPISPIIAKLLLKQFDLSEEKKNVPELLTERQRKILKLIGQGFSSREISEKLSISYYTVTTHIKNIYEKLQVNSRTEALHEAIKMGLIN